MKQIRSNEKRAKNAIILIWIVLATEILSLVSGYLQYDLIQTVANGGEIIIERANANDFREQIVGIIYLVFFIISAVTFIQWFRRAYFNLHQKVNYLSHSEEWASGSWFVPFVNLYRPFQIMKELYEETITLLNKNGLNFNQNFSTRVLVWWWSLWILNNLVGQVSARYAMRAETVGELLDMTALGMFANIIAIPLAFLAVKVVKDYASIEPLLNEIKEDDVLELKSDL